MSHGGDLPGSESALLVLVPAADPVVGLHRDRLDLSARDGVPAHLTVLYPFLPPERIGPGELASLARLFTGFPAFGFTLDRVGWFGDAVAWLGPANEAPFRALTGLAAPPTRPARPTAASTTRWSRTSPSATSEARTPSGPQPI